MFLSVTVVNREPLRARWGLIWAAAGLSFTERVEILCVLAGTKPLVRLVADDSTVAGYERLADLLGLTFRKSSVRQAPVLRSGGDVYTVSVEWSDERGRWFSVFLSPAVEIAVAAVEAEMAGKDSEVIGGLLGYPRCCTESYEARGRGCEWISEVVPRCPEPADIPKASNPFARLFSGYALIPDLFPCSLTCSGTHRFAIGAITVLQAAGANRELRRAFNELAKPVLYADGQLLQIGAWTRTPDHLKFDPSSIRAIDTSWGVSDELQGGILNTDNAGRVSLPSDRGWRGGWRLMEFTDRRYALISDGE